MFKKLDALVDILVKMGIPGLDLSVRVHGNEVYRRFEGYSDASKTIPMNGKERLNLYSCTKPITCTAALQLFERGLFSLDDKLSTYLPEFSDISVLDGTIVRPAGKDIKIHQLFSMTAGFSYDLNSKNLQNARRETGGICRTRDVMRYLAKDPLLFDPGRSYNYSLCHDVLGALVEVIADKPFGEYVKENIFDVVGMTNSTFLPSEEEISDLAEQYRYNAETKIYEPIGGANDFRLGKMYESGGAGCVSTLDDYTKFIEALRIGNIILKDETIDLMSTNRLLPRQLPAFTLSSYGYGYGLGVRCEVDGSGSTDFGWGGAAGSYIGCDRKNDFTFVYMQHVLGMENGGIRHSIPFYIRQELEK